MTHAAYQGNYVVPTNVKKLDVLLHTMPRGVTTRTHCLHCLILGVKSTRLTVVAGPHSCTLQIMAMLTACSCS